MLLERLRRTARGLCGIALAMSALSLMACAPVTAPAPAATPAKAAQREAPVTTLTLPAHPADAQGGRRFVRSLKNADEQGREKAILREVSRGNIPESLRSLSRIDFKAAARSGTTHSVTLWVTRDYLAVGSDADNVRMPMGAVTAQLVADVTGCVLPTAKIVDMVYKLADVKLAPRSFPPGPWMVHVEEFARHNDAVNAQLRGPAKEAAARSPSGITAGHKKDVVLSNRLEEKPHRVAIYGWHRPNGSPIQPLSISHGDWYSDYSHGVRLIGKVMLIDGEPRRVTDVLRDPELASLLCDEGALVRARYRTEDGPGKTKWWPPVPPPNPPPSAQLSISTPSENQ